MDTERLAEWFREFADVESTDMPLYAALSAGIAEDAEMLDLLATAAPGQWRPVLLFAALHDLVLRHPDEPYARLYPTVGGSFDPVVDPMPVLAEFVDTHRRALRELVASRSTQTNEVNRSCLWYAAVRAAAADLPDTPLALVEVGASAGLNLRFDDYSYDFGEETTRGSSGSGVELLCEIRNGEPPIDATLPPIVARVGLDRSPIDLTDESERRWLKACIWPEQPERHRRFDAAVTAALADPPEVRPGDAVDAIAELVDGLPRDTHVVIVHSWVMTYLAHERRHVFGWTVDLLGASRDLTLLSAEADGCVDWVPKIGGDIPYGDTVVGMSRWRGGTRTDELIAVCHPHLRWLDWRQ